jgi:hypothetical protein
VTPRAAAPAGEVVRTVTDAAIVIPAAAWMRRLRSIRSIVEPPVLMVGVVGMVVLWVATGQSLYQLNATAGDTRSRYGDRRRRWP